MECSCSSLVAEEIFAMEKFVWHHFRRFSPSASARHSRCEPFQRRHPMVEMSFRTQRTFIRGWWLTRTICVCAIDSKRWPWSPPKHSGECFFFFGKGKTMPPEHQKSTRDLLTIYLFKKCTLLRTRQIWEFGHNCRNMQIRIGYFEFSQKVCRGFSSDNCFIC